MTERSNSSSDSVLVGVAGETLAAALRRGFPDRSWRQVREMCSSGKVRIDGQVSLDPASRLSAGMRVTVRLHAPRVDRDNGPRIEILFEDAHLIVIDKPEDVASVPYERLDKGTAIDLIRAAWKREGRAATVTPLYTVHRLDKDTSGILCFGKTKLGERGLHLIFKQHLAQRSYVAVTHGAVRPGRHESYLIADRGDGLRGSTRFADQGQHAITHVVSAEPVGGEWPPALAPTLVRLRLETGRTHQIRIHMAEAGRGPPHRPDSRADARPPGHPLVGETVYVRDFRRAGCEPIDCPRLLLHAETLGFTHPVTGEALLLHRPLPPSFEKALARLRGVPFR